MNEGLCNTDITKIVDDSLCGSLWAVHHSESNKIPMGILTTLFNLKDDSEDLE